MSVFYAAFVMLFIAASTFTWLISSGFAQTPQQPPALTPEQQIEALQQQTIDLRKQNGQLISQMAFCEEYALKIKKELAQAKDHAAAQGKAAEKK